MQDNDLISVVIPTRNRCDRLMRAIASVKAQSWSNVEIIVVDDASSDETPSYLKQSALRDTRIRYIRNEAPRGGGGARNLGIEATRGVYVAFLDDDDIWHPDKLAVQVEVMKRNPHVSAVSCAFQIQHSFFPNRNIQISSPADKQQLLRSNHLGGASMCFTSRAILQKIGGFDAALPSGQDWDLWIKLFDFGEIQTSRKPLVVYVPHQGVRITGNPRSAYVGRRKIYIRNQSEMSEATRRYCLCELIFHRKILLTRGWKSNSSGLVFLTRYAFGINLSRYIYRYLKFVFLR